MEAGLRWQVSGGVLAVAFETFTRLVRRIAVTNKSLCVVVVVVEALITDGIQYRHHSHRTIVLPSDPPVRGPHVYSVASMWL